MDYTKYYLRNYRPDDDDNADDTARPVYRELPDRPHIPEIVYINPDGEEFVPQAQTAPKESKREVKKPFFTRLVINVLIGLVVILSLFVSVDFVTDGRLVEEVTHLIYDEKPYYAVLELPADTPQEALKNAQTLRIGGKAGYPISYDGRYYCAAELYDNRTDAENSEHSSSAVIYELTLKKPELPDEYDKYIERPHRMFDDLKDVEQKLQSGEIGEREALLKVEELYEQALLEADELKNLSEDRATKAVLEFVSDYSVAVATFEMLCSDEPTNMTFVGDLKYARCQIMFAFAL